MHITPQEGSRISGPNPDHLYRLRKEFNMGKTPDEKRQEEARRAGKVCSSCNGTGTYGVRSFFGSTNPCSKCNGTGQR